MMTSRKSGKRKKKSGFKKKNGLQIITRERVRFNIWEMLLHRLSPICISRSNSLIFNFANKKKKTSMARSTFKVLFYVNGSKEKKTVLSPSWDE